MTPCLNCGSDDCVIKETYMTATFTLHNGFCLKCSTRGEFCKTEAEAIAAWAMPAARKDEHQKVFAEVHDLISDTLGIWRDGHCFIVAQDVLVALAKLEAGK